METSGKMGIATGKNCGGETAAASSSRSAAVLVRSPHPAVSTEIGASSERRRERRKERRRKRRRRTATSSPPGQKIAVAVEKNTDSSEYSSPIRRPKSLALMKVPSSGDVGPAYNKNRNREAVDAYHRDFHKYQKKLARQEQLPTLKRCKSARNITDWHDLNQKNAVLDVAESVLSLSSSHDGIEIRRCCAILIGWAEVNNSAIIVTSSQIICTETSLDDWEDNNVYAPDAKVIAHLMDGSTSELTLLYFSKHYEIAFFKVLGVSNLQIATLEPKLVFGENACILARDKDHDLICRRTIVEALDPCGHQKNHFLFISGSTRESCTGGALIDFDRNVVGMVVNAMPNIAFIPSSLIIICLRLWQKFKRIARPHLGLKLRTVEFMDISHLEHLSRNFKIRSGLIVGKVSSDSPAERNGIRVGDIICSCQGDIVSTVNQFEGILLDICEKQFEKDNNLDSKVDIELDVYEVRKHCRRRKVTLSVELSDCMEAVI